MVIYACRGKKFAEKSAMLRHKNVTEESVMCEFIEIRLKRDRVGESGKKTAKKRDGQFLIFMTSRG